MNQPKDTPFFYIQDESVFIYPSPDVDVTNGLEFFLIHKPSAITTASTEAQIDLPLQFHKLLSDGLRIDIFLWQGKTNEAQAAQILLDDGIKDMIAFMKQRYNQPIPKQNTNLDNFR